MQALNNEYKEWVKRLQAEKTDSEAQVDQFEDRCALLMQRVEQLELANAALLARNKVLEVMSDPIRQQEIEESVRGKLQTQKAIGSLTQIKNEIPSDYEPRIKQLKKVLLGSKLSQNNLEKVELLLRDHGADYFKILRNDSVEVKHYTQYDLIWRYHGVGEDFIVYIDFD